MLCLGHAFVSAAPFANADRIVRIVCVADRNQPLVVARLKLSKPEGESPLLTHTTELLPVQQIVYSHETMFPRDDALWMTTSFSDYSTMAIFQARSSVTRVIFVLRGSSYPATRQMKLRR